MTTNLSYNQLVQICQSKVSVENWCKIFNHVIDYPEENMFFNLNGIDEEDPCFLNAQISFRFEMYVYNDIYRYRRYVLFQYLEFSDLSSFFKVFTSRLNDYYSLESSCISILDSYKTLIFSMIWKYLLSKNPHKTKQQLFIEFLQLEDQILNPEISIVDIIKDSFSMRYTVKDGFSLQDIVKDNFSLQDIVIESFSLKRKREIWELEN